MGKTEAQLRIQLNRCQRQTEKKIACKMPFFLRDNKGNFKLRNDVAQRHLHPICVRVTQKSIPSFCLRRGVTVFWCSIVILFQGVLALWFQ